MPAQPYLHLPTDGDTASGPAPIAHAASAVAAAAAGLRASSFNHPQSSYPHAAPAAEQGRQARHGSTQTLSLDGSAERLNQFADLMNVEAGSAVAMSVGDWDHLAGTGFHR